MMGPVLVFGHRNPDNDSVCSAIAYAHLKNLTDPANVYVPVRLGPLMPETTWTLERFAVAVPELIEHVRTRVRDVMTTDVVTVSPRDTLYAVGRLMSERGVRALPVVEDGHVRGLIGLQTLAARYIEDQAVSGFQQRPVTVGQVVDTLGGRLLTGHRSDELAGSVVIGAMEPDTLRSFIFKGDILIVGDRRRTQPMAIEAGIAALVVTGGFEPGDDVVAAARNHGCAVIVTDRDTYGAARLMNLSHAAGEFMDPDPLVVDPDMLLSEAAEELFTSPQREALVAEPDGFLVGILTRTNVARAPRRPVILVDHNEAAQSADGVEDASVVEIVDHHRIGDIETAQPITFLNLPVGATATIVAQRFRDLDVDPPAAIAGVLLSAVLTDTVLLKSPTTTDLDRGIAEWLASEAGVDATEFGVEMFRARSIGQVFSPELSVGADLKEYHVGDVLMGIGQVETVDLESVLAHRDELLAYMTELARVRGFGLLALMVTDVVREGSQLLVVGKVRLAERAFGVDFEDGSAWFDGMLSRKKQVAARLIDSVGR
jgi:manganese-dependent inorganic pyrophosphatase